MSYLCHSLSQLSPSIPQAVPTEAASERRGEAPTEAQLHSARLTGETGFNKSNLIYIFNLNIKRTNVIQVIQDYIGSTKIYKIYKRARFLAWNYYGRSGQDFSGIHLPP